MVSDRPLPDRCGAKVVDNVGLEIELEDGSVLTDEQFDAVLLSDGEHTIEGEPIYSELREYLWDDFDPVAIAVSADTELVGVDVEAMDADDGEISADMTAGVPGASAEHSWLSIEESYENVTNRYSELEGYCERWPMNDANSCYVHNNGEGAEEGNTRAMKHGLYAQRTNYYKALEGEDKEFVEAMVDSWLDKAPFDRTDVGMVNELYRAAIDQHRAWGGIDSYVEDGEIQGLTEEVEQFNDDGQMIEVEMEQPQNIAYSRLDGDVRQKLRDIGVYDSPEQQQAEATESLASKLSDMSRTN